MWDYYDIKKASGDLTKRVQEMEFEADRLLKILKLYEQKAMRERDESKDINTRGKKTIMVQDRMEVGSEDIMPADVFEAKRLLETVKNAIRRLRERGNLVGIEIKYGE